VSYTLPTSTLPTNDLTSNWLRTYQRNLALFEDYYRGVHPTSMLTHQQRHNNDYARFWAPINICRVIVDEPIGYLTHAAIEITADPPELQEWADWFLNQRIRPRMDDLIRYQGAYGDAYLYLWTDYNGLSRGIKAKALPPIEGGQQRVLADYGGEDDEELTTAIIHYRVPQPGGVEGWNPDPTSKDAVEKYRVTLTRDRIVIDKQDERGKEERVSDTPNPTGAIPLIPIPNNNASDLLDILPIQDDLNKLYFDLRQVREWHGFPMLNVNGVDGADVPANLLVGPGKVLRNVNVNRIEAGDLSQILDAERRLFERAAMMTSSLILMERATGDPSGVALRYLQQGLEAKLRGKASRLQTGIAQALKTAALWMARVPELYALEKPQDAGGRPVDPSVLEGAEFIVRVNPSIPADELRAAQRAEILKRNNLLSDESILRGLGVPDPQGELDRLEDEARKALVSGGGAPPDGSKA